MGVRILKKNKAILWSVAILFAVTSVLFIALSMASARNSKNTKGPIPSGKITAEKKGGDEIVLSDDGDRCTSREILDEIINLGSGSGKESSEKKEAAVSARHEISREKYETCGYDSGYVMVKYSDGSFEIVEE